MPELPEVETIRRDLAQVILHRKIVAVKVLSSKTVFPFARKFVSLIQGQKFADISRVGKLLILSFVGQDYFLLIHLKMTGQLIYLDRGKVIAGGHSLKNLLGGDKLPNKTTRVYFSLAGGSDLFFNDQRRFGYLKIVKRSELEQIKQRYGIEPLTPGFKLVDFAAVISGRTKNIKALLLDQSLISGLGNIYADEALFLAGIKPSRRASSLKKAEIEKLFQVISPLIRSAVKHRGTTFSDYRDGSGRRGGFSAKLQVYGRNKEKCYNCGGIIQKIKVAGRGTHFCPHCQK